jgi:hypothetical protein
MPMSPRRYQPENSYTSGGGGGAGMSAARTVSADQIAAAALATAIRENFTLVIVIPSRRQRAGNVVWRDDGS